MLPSVDDTALPVARAKAGGFRKHHGIAAHVSVILYALCYCVLCRDALCVHVHRLQAGLCLPWLCRSPWVHCIVNGSVRAGSQSALLGPGIVHPHVDEGDGAPAQERDLRELLTDYRLTRVHGKIAASHIAGKAVSFLSQCCDSISCFEGESYEEDDGSGEEEF